VQISKHDHLNIIFGMITVFQGKTIQMQDKGPVHQISNNTVL